MFIHVYEYADRIRFIATATTPGDRHSHQVDDFTLERHGGYSDDELLLVALGEACRRAAAREVNRATGRRF